jgi:hypothetical protein
MVTRKQRMRRKRGIRPPPKRREASPPAEAPREDYFARRERERLGLLAGPSYHWRNPALR